MIGFESIMFLSKMAKVIIGLVIITNVDFYISVFNFIIMSVFTIYITIFFISTFDCKPSRIKLSIIKYINKHIGNKRFIKSKFRGSRLTIIISNTSTSTSSTRFIFMNNSSYFIILNESNGSICNSDINTFNNTKSNIISFCT